MTHIQFPNQFGSRLWGPQDQKKQQRSTIPFGPWAKSEDYEIGWADGHKDGSMFSRRDYRFFYVITVILNFVGILLILLSLRKIKK